MDKRGDFFTKSKNMNNQQLNQSAKQAIQLMPWLSGITSEKQYKEALELLCELVVDYDQNQSVIDLLFPIIEGYENIAPHFKEFAREVEPIDSGVLVLRSLIEHHQLTLSDFENELGKKAHVSMILNGRRQLTIKHIKALATRFNIPASLFVFWGRPNITEEAESTVKLSRPIPNPLTAQMKTKLLNKAL